MSRIRCAATSIAVCASIVAVATPVAAGKAVTMHFFAKQVYFRGSDASGKRKPPNAVPVVGDRLSFADNYYAGNHKHHASKATASDHVDCTVTGTSTALCDGVIAIGGSMIIGDDFVINFNKNITRVKITGGTGRYRHAHGTVTNKSVSSSTSDVTIKLS